MTPQHGVLNVRLLRFIVFALAFASVVTFLAVDASDKVVLPTTSSTFSPSLASFHGRLYIAWTTNYEIHVGTVEAGQLKDDHGIGEFSHHGPALSVFNDRLCIAWTGTDKNSLLNVKSSQDGWTFTSTSKAQVPGEASAHGPALAVFNNRLFMAWTGVDQQHSLNIISSADGVTFPPSNKQPLGQSSVAGPSLTITPAYWDSGIRNEKLIITWTGPDHGMNIAGSDDGAHFDFSDTRIPSQTSNDRPVIIPWTSSSGVGVMNLWFTGTDSRLNQMASLHGPKGSQFEGPATYDDTSVAGPSLIPTGLDLTGFLAWSGTDSAHHVNVKTLPWPR
jgi:hypothetical protein